MLEIAVHDAAHGDGLAEPGHPWAETTDTADDEVDVDPGLGRAVECFDDLLVHQCVHLHDDARRQTRVRVPRLACDEFQDAVVHLEVGNDELARALKLADPGQKVEQVRGILAEIGPAGE